VVFLRGVDPQLAHPWDHAPVIVEFRDRRLVVVQGDRTGHVGFVRHGDSVQMVSREPLFNSLQANGATFFSLPFPDPDQPLKRSLKKQGLVELTSGAGCYWMRAYLFLSDHPYFAHTDAKGNFALAQVPPGKYQIVCWLPNWHKKAQDHDPETALVTRLFFHAPLEVQREVVVDPAGNAVVDFDVDTKMFDR
jgi:hypothetical protein